MPSLTTREILENQFNGLTPIKRQNPQYGEKDYYYINPNRDRYSSLSDEDIAYVDSPDVPNPFLQQSSTTNPLSSSSSNKMGTDTTGLTDTSSFGNTSSLTNDIFSTTRSSSSSDLTNNSLLGTNNNTVQVKTLYPPQINQTSSGQKINAVNYGEIWPTKKYLSSSTHNNSLDTPTKTYPLLSEVKNEIINANGVTRQIYDVYSLYNNINDGIEAVKMGYDVYSNFKNANKQLIQKYGRNTGAADGTDNYYHPLLMCKLAQKSPFSRNMGLYMGYGKEIADLSQKLTNKEKYPLSAIEYVKDSIKDLQNNLYGSKLGNYNPNISCEELLEPLRTENMRRENIQ